MLIKYSSFFIDYIIDRSKVWGFKIIFYDTHQGCIYLIKNTTDSNIVKY